MIMPRGLSAARLGQRAMFGPQDERDTVLEAVVPKLGFVDAWCLALYLGWVDGHEWTGREIAEQYGWRSSLYVIDKARELSEKWARQRKAGWRADPNGRAAFMRSVLQNEGLSRSVKSYAVMAWDELLVAGDGGWDRIKKAVESWRSGG